MESESSGSSGETALIEIDVEERENKLNSLVLN
jgi:hypothetical protein